MLVRVEYLYCRSICIFAVRSTLFLDDPDYWNFVFVAKEQRLQGSAPFCSTLIYLAGAYYEAHGLAGLTCSYNAGALTTNMCAATLSSCFV